MTKPDSKIFRFFSAYVGFAERHTKALLGVFLLLFFGSLYFAVRLELRTDMAELLPVNHPSVTALHRVAGRQKSATNLVMIVHSPSAEANHKFAEYLRPRLQGMIPHTFSDIQWHPDEERPIFAEKWKWLWAELSEIENAESLLDRIIAKRTSPLAVDLEGDPDQELKELREKLNQRLPAKADSNYFEGEEKGTHYLGIMLWRKRDGLATRGDHDTLEAVKALVKNSNPTSFHAAMKVDFTGHIAQAIDEQNGIRDDLTIATAVCGSLVLLVIYLYFRRLGLLWVVGTPAVLGLLLALTVASFTVHYLNINTAFLVSIILGNGINSPIILLARYGEERKRSVPVAQSITVAMSETLLGTATAMLAASISYGCLLLTTFRGFSQFGLIGGVGMLLVWIVTFFLVPPLVIFGERIRPGCLTPRGNLWQIPFGFVGRIAQKHPGKLAAFALALFAASAVPFFQYVKAPLEWNIDNLRTVRETPSQFFWPRMEKLGMGDVGAGYIGNNAVMLVDTPEQADPVADEMRRQDAARGAEHVLKEVRTIHSVLPKNQAEKLEILGRIRRKIDRRIDTLGEDEKKELQAWRPPDWLRPMVVEDLPKIVREAFTETDGQFGRLIGVDADNKTYYDWNGHDLLRMSKALTVNAEGKTWVAYSAANIFAGMLETLIADGPRVSAVALVGVIFLILGLFGFRGALPVLAALALGIAWLGGIAGLTHLKINFMNFVALPITLGVGTDYAANIWARIRHDGPDQLAHIFADTGSAVALCSMTTMIGYSSLLLSHNRALRSFGLMADFGEITCLLAALMLLPFFARYFEKSRT